MSKAGFEPTTFGSGVHHEALRGLSAVGNVI